MNKKFYLIIVAAGNGTRAKTDIPKQYVIFGKYPLLYHTISAFSKIKNLCHVCLVVNPKDEAHYNNVLKLYYANNENSDNKISICTGGEIRQQSVHNGLKSLKQDKSIKDDDIVLIHDAARPFVLSKDIYSLLNAMKKHKGASLAHVITDTCRTVNKANIAQNIVERSNLWTLQTPQAFHYDVILKAHENISNSNKIYTDDTSLVSEAGYDVALIPASRHNFKMTTKEDILMAERLLSTSLHNVIRSGIGYDVHAFDTHEQSVKTIKLCGVDVECNRKLKGHSDADVALHALCDAIYGAIGEGDIGLHFPPKNMKYKNVDSRIFLKHAISLLHSKNGKINNVDITLICEFPRIKKYRNKMVEHLAQIMSVPLSTINVKATTTEQLGFEGRKEGIAAQAIVTISVQKHE